MESKLVIYNTLTRQKERFEPLHAPNVGMYVCGPTVYGDPHLGHARPAITFDLVFRYLKHLGYKVRYVRNITDVGHLEHDADEGEDKIAKKARLEQLEPMEIAQYYTNRYHQYMDMLNVLRPSIEPHATGHIIEQQQLVQQILDNGFAYESNGSIYFDIEAYNKQYKYGILSGRSLENIKDASRDNLDGVGEKRNQADFALWKKAQPEHIMRWPSPWSDGFPGWHCECTAMGRKYLGEEFDIHGGGMDLIFPHHECEIAQAQASMGHPAVKYWMHNNMLTINGQKMGKSYNNFITLDEKVVKNLRQKCYDAMNDDLATPQVISNLFEACTTINKLVDHKATICADCLKELKEVMNIFAFDILGLKADSAGSNDAREEAFGKVVDMVLDLRAKAKANKDWATSDQIRDELAAAGFEVKDTKDGVTWKLNK